MSEITYPSTSMKDAYSRFLDQYLEDDQDYYSALKDLYESVDENVEHLILKQLAWHKNVGLPDGWFPVTTLWLVVDDEIVAEGIIRHDLNEFLRNFAGHITYYVAPNYRGKGYGKVMLEALKKECQKIGIRELIICCDENNLSSKKIIEKSGATKIDVIDNIKDFGEMTCRYASNLVVSEK